MGVTFRIVGQAGYERCEAIAMDGRVLFEVMATKKAGEIDVRAVECCMVDGVMHGTSIVIKPHVSNRITLSTEVF